MNNVYTSGEFAKKANLTIRTIRYYDNKGLLKPSFKDENGKRYYTNDDFTKLQQILLFKYLGMSLDDIKELTVASSDEFLLLSSLQIQRKLIEEKIDELRNIHNTINKSIALIENGNAVDYENMLDLIKTTTIEETFKKQYQNESNISARISLHRDYSTNKDGWFPWIYRHCGLSEEYTVLEIGCGNGELWLENFDKLPRKINIMLSDISKGMIKDVKKSIKDNRFNFDVFDACEIPYGDNCFDVVIANHMLFYCKDVNRVISECYRVLKSNGILVCSTYGRNHMKEITDLVKNFNSDIVLSKNNLFDKFGKENGKELLNKYFNEVNCYEYDDSIVIDKSEPLIRYILSCHGNQNFLLVNSYKEFRDYVNDIVKDGFYISKDACVFICKKL